MRPVISERASACACAVRPSRGTKYHIAPAYRLSQSTNGPSIHRSKVPSTAAMVRK